MSFYLRSKKPGAIFPKRLSNERFEQLMNHAYHHGFRGEKLSTCTAEQFLRPYLKDGEVSNRDAEALALALHQVDKDMTMHRDEEFASAFRALLQVSEEGAFGITKIDAKGVFKVA